MICGIDTATICTAIEVHKLDHLQIFAIICGTGCHNSRLRAQRSCSGDVRVARVHVIALVVDAVVGLTLGLIARVIIVVFVVAFP